MIDARSGALTEVSSPMLAVGLHKGEGLPQELEQATASILSNGDFSGKEGETALVYAPEGLATPRLLFVGLGERASFTLEKLRRASATVAQHARALKLAEAAFEGSALGLYRFDRYKTNAESRELKIFTLISDDKEAATAGAETGAKVAAAGLLARDLANEPSNTATPEYLAERAHEIAGRYGMEVSVLDRAG